MKRMAQLVAAQQSQTIEIFPSSGIERYLSGSFPRLLFNSFGPLDENVFLLQERIARQSHSEGIESTLAISPDEGRMRYAASALISNGKCISTTIQDAPGFVHLRHFCCRAERPNYLLKWDFMDFKDSLHQILESRFSSLLTASKLTACDNIISAPGERNLFSPLRFFSLSSVHNESQVIRQTTTIYDNYSGCKSIL